MSEPVLTCPECGSDRVTTAHKTINEMDGLYQAAPKAAPEMECPSREKLRDMRHYLVEAHGFAAMSPRGKENIAWALEILDELESLASFHSAPKPAPQQEAQEPAFVDVSLRTAIAKAVYQQVRVEFEYRLCAWTALDADEQQRIVDSIRGLYIAPQPAPAPLSEMPYEKRKAIQEGEQIGAIDAAHKQGGAT